MPVGEVREMVGPDMLIGLSTHATTEIDAVDPALVDYIGVGPVHETPTKEGRPAVGVELVRYAAANARVAVLRDRGAGRGQHRRGDRGRRRRAPSCCARSPTPRTREAAARELRAKLGGAQA